MLQAKSKGLARQLQSPFFCANSNTQRVMHDQPPARKLFQILLHFGKSARYFSKLDIAPQDARKPFICPNISHNLPLSPVSNLIFQTSTRRSPHIHLQKNATVFRRVFFALDFVKSAWKADIPQTSAHCARVFAPSHCVRRYILRAAADPRAQKKIRIGTAEGGFF